MEVKSRARYLRISPRKLALVADYVRGKKVQSAINDLSLSPKKGARFMEAIIKSGVANAPDSVDVDNLFVKTVFVTSGGMLKRFMPRAQGRATSIRKRMSHVTMILDEK
jgi:large subunit ribosomal protein L22